MGMFLVIMSVCALEEWEDLVKICPNCEDQLGLKTVSDRCDRSATSRSLLLCMGG